MDTMAQYKKKAPPAAAVAAVQRQEKTGKVNRTGMPDHLKSSIESMSGYSMDPVRVHYNSSRPAELQALAYTQGTEIHVAPGQERHLPHEAWHVVQQMQGRVRPTMRIKGVGVNGSPALEQEADVMGRRAVQGVFLHTPAKASLPKSSCVQAALPAGVNWGTIYQGIAPATAFAPGRTIQDSQNLIGVLDTPAHNDTYYKRTLEEDGLRRLAYDIKQVKRRIKQAAGAAGNPFGPGNAVLLSNAQQLINNKIMAIENQKYGVGWRRERNYVNQENNVHFNNMKVRARAMLQRVQGKNNSYLGKYFNAFRLFHRRRRFAPGEETIYYNRVKGNFQTIENHLNNIGYKDNYSQRAGVYAYVYPGAAQPAGAMLGGVNVGGTHIRSKMHGGAETGMQIRLSNAYRRAPERGRDSKPGVIIHEASHLILGTKDHAYGRAIYRLDRNQAIENADTYEYAAEDA